MCWVASGMGRAAEPEVLTLRSVDYEAPESLPIRFGATADEVPPTSR